MSDLPVRVVAVPDPFSSERTLAVMPQGPTLAEVVASVGIAEAHHARVFIEVGDMVYGPIPAAHWPHIRPKPGSTVIVRSIPGAGDQNTGKALTIVIWIAVAILSYLFPPFAWLFILGGIALTAVTLYVTWPQPLAPRLGDITPRRLQGESPTYALGGSRNTARQWAPIPVIYGQHRVYPPFGALPVTELVGNDQYLRELFVVGYGPLDLTDLKIGDTPIANFEDVEVEIRQGYPGDDPMSLYSQDIDELALQVTLVEDEPQSRVGGQAADEVSVDITFPSGLCWFNTNGDRYAISCDFTVEYRLVGAGSWTAAPGGNPWTITDNKGSQVRRGLRWAVATHGDIEVRITRLTANRQTGDLQYHDESVWTALRTILWGPAVTKSGLCQVALRIKATDQLQGIVDQFNCLAQAILPDWDNGTQQWVTRATSSPAAAYRAALQGNGNARPVADARLHLPSLQQWAVDAAAAGMTFNQVVDFRHTVFEQLRDIAASTRAGFTMIDGKFGVVQDKAQTTPVQHFTPRNSFNFHGRKTFLDIPHAFKVRFINPEADWQQDERIVYDDGYNEANATRFEVLETLGVTSADQAWKLGRYHLAGLRLRPELYEFNTDFENLVCTRGDLIRVAHDVMAVGLAQGRVISVQSGGGNCTGITLDELCPMSVGKSYGVRMRYADGTSVVKVIVTNPGLQAVLVFETPFAAPWPAVGDLVLFGESGLESMPVIVKEITHERDLVAKITCLPYDANIYTADQGAIPEFVSYITAPPNLHQAPPIPIIDDVRSDETVLLRDLDGSLASQIVVNFHLAAATGITPDSIDVQVKPSDGVTWTALPSLAPGTTEASIRPVEDGMPYDVRLRTATQAGATSEWAGLLNHTVIGKTTKPPDPTGLSLQNGILSWVYTEPPRDLLGFHIRRIPGGAAIWDQGLQMHSGAYSATAYALAAIMFGEWTLMVKAVDTAGHFSDGMATLTYDFGTGLLHNAVESRDEHAYGFPGTKTDCTVEGGTGDLIADSVATGFWTQDNALFWTADGNAFWGGTYEEMVYQWTYTTGASAGGTSLLVDVGAQGNWRMEYKKSADSDWLPVQGSVPGMLANTSYDLRLTIDAGAVQGRVSQLVLYFDAPDVDEAFAAFATAVTTGTRLTLTKTYRAIKTVNPTVVASGAETAISALAADKQATAGANNGPLIKSLDAAGNVVAGHVDVLVRGY